MTIEQEKVDKSTAVLTLSGRLDTANAPLLERKIKQWGEEITELVLDFAELTYISSMGLRVLLQAKKTLKAEKRKMTIKNMNDSIREVFEMTGFLHLMVQEEKFVVIRKNEPDSIVLSLNGEMRLENIPILSEELSDIKEQSLHKPITREVVLSEELTEVLEHGSVPTVPVTVILDMEGLTDFSPVAIKSLKQAITGTAWEERILKVRHASSDMQDALKNGGMKELLE